MNHYLLKLFREDNLKLTMDELAEKIGVSRSLIGFIEKRKVNITPGFERKFRAKYGAQFDTFVKGANVNNLLLSKEPKEGYNSKKIPLYDVDFSAGPIEMFDDNIDLLPIITIWDAGEYANGAEFGARIMGQSMAPTYNDKCFLFFKAADKENIKYGEAYGVRTSTRRTVKYLRKSNNPKTVLLVPENTKKFDTEEIKLNDIIKLWEVVGELSV